MWKWMLLFIATLSGLVYLVIDHGLKPKAIRLIDPTSFENLESVGAVTVRRLFPQWNQYSVWVFGSSPLIKNYESVWTGFLKTGRSQSFQFDLVFEENLLRPMPIWSDQTKNRFSTFEDFPLEEIKSAIQSGKRVLIHASAFHSSFMQPHSLSKQLQETLKVPVIAITQQPFAVRREAIAKIQPPCEGPTDVSCLAHETSRRYLRKNLPLDQITAVMEQHGGSDYILFLYQP